MHRSTVQRFGIALFVIGLATTAWSVYSGLIGLYLVVIVPVLTSESAFGALPLLAVFAGIVLMAFGPTFGEGQLNDQAEGGPKAENRATRDRTKIGGVVLIGPIPILFGSDRRMTLIAAAVVITMLALLILLL